MNAPWLTIILVIPVGGALLLQLIPRRMSSAIKGVTLIATGGTATLVGLVIAWLPTRTGTGQPLVMYFQERHDWIHAIGASYHVGIDGVSASLLALNAGVFLLGALVVSRRSTDRLRFFCTLLLITETATSGVLLSLDLLLFYLFW